MKKILLAAPLILLQLYVYCQIKQTTASASAENVTGTVLNITWLGSGSVKLLLNNEMFFFQYGETQTLRMVCGKSYLLKAEKPYKSFTCKAPLVFEPGRQSITVSLAGDSVLVVTTPNKVANQLKKQMIMVKGGSFIMGCGNNSDTACFNQWNQQKITLSSFSISEYDITQEQWLSVMGYNPSHFKNCADCPVEMVSWNEVQKFIETLNRVSGLHFRLPTESEWEYAARGGNKSHGYKYAGGNNIDSVAWFSGNSTGKTHRVGMKTPNELGLYDMTGNVWQWCSDWYSYEYLSRRPVTNPQGAETGLYRLVRGGSWLDGANGCNIFHRQWIYPETADGFDGFRLVLDIQNVNPDINKE